MLFAHVTSRVEGRKHEALFEKTGAPGFPYLCMMDDTGGIVAKLDGERDLAGFQAMAESAKEFFALKAKAAGGDAAARVDFALRQGELGHIDTDALKTAVEGAEMTEAQKKSYRSIVADKMVEKILKTAVGERFAAMEKDGLIPSDKNTRTQFYSSLLEYAEYKKDAAGFERALGALRAMHGDNPQAAGFFATKEATLKELKGGG